MMYRDNQYDQYDQSNQYDQYNDKQPQNNQEKEHKLEQELTTFKKSSLCQQNDWKIEINATKCHKKEYKAKRLSSPPPKTLTSL